MKTSRIIISLVMVVVTMAFFCLSAAATEMGGSSGVESSEELPSVATVEDLNINNIQLQPTEMPPEGSNGIEDETVQDDMEPDKDKNGDSYTKIRLSAVDAQGNPIMTPNGNASQAINVKVPLMCKGETIYDLEIVPVLSENLDEFPFLIERLDYTQVYKGRVLPDEVVVFDYNFTLSSRATSGTKKVEFQVSYWFNNRMETATIPVFVNVVKGYEETPKQDVEVFTSTPKVILQSFSVDRNQIYAGETFTIDVELKNTSSQNVKNLKMTVSEESGSVFPALGTTNSIYVEKILAQETANVQLCLQSPADLQEKIYRLSVLLEYESSVNNQTFSATETVSIYVMQPISVKMQNPIIHEEAWLDQRCSGSILLFNMGRSSIYNCMVTIEGSGLSLEENYYGGTVVAGTSMRAEFEIIPHVEGEVTGNIVITYEDVSGNKFEEKRPVSLYVNKDYTQTAPNLETLEPSEKNSNGSSNTGWLIVLLVIAFGMCIVLPFAIVRRNQKRKLKDL